LNIQTEKLDNHVARLTVEIEEKLWEQAKQKAARNLSKRYRIPGFRKGKAPYSVILRYVGEAPITQSAIESLGNELYKDVLKQSDIDPYTSGSLEDFKLEPKPT
jgi:trigger factor